MLNTSPPDQKRTCFMNQELLCSWLGLASKEWPPDHYTLLGLRAGELDLQRIERQVQERMAKLRCYQLSHPEEATEGMNRLAQAFISLTEAASKAARPAPPVRRKVTPPAPQPRTNGKQSRPPAPAKRPDDTAILNQTKLDWRLTPPPIRAASSAPPAVEEPPEPPPVGKLVTPPPAAPAVDEAAEMIRNLACQSPEARTGLATLAAVIDRVDQTRVLLRAWQRLGIYLRKKRLSAAENAELPRLLATIGEVTEVYPAFVGHPGKPGYRVVAMARLAMTFDMFRNMDAGPREDLLRDWDIGQRILLEHRRFLRQQFKAMRSHSAMGLVMRAVSTVINDHPILFGAGAIALIGMAIVVRSLWF